MRKYELAPTAAEYVAPAIEVVEVEVERGFAQTSAGDTVQGLDAPDQTD